MTLPQGEGGMEEGREGQEKKERRETERKRERSPSPSRNFLEPQILCATRPLLIPEEIATFNYGCGRLEEEGSTQRPRLRV